MFGLDGQAVLEHGLLAGFIVGGQSLGAELLQATLAAEEVEGGHENEGNKNENKDGDEGVDHLVGAIVRVGVSGDESAEGRQAGPLGATLFEDNGHVGHRRQPQLRGGSHGLMARCRC